MKKIIPIASTIITALIFFVIGKGIGEWYADQLKNSGGMVTASELIQCNYIIPIIAAIIGGWIAYYLTNEK